MFEILAGLLFGLVLLFGMFIPYIIIPYANRKEPEVAGSVVQQVGEKNEIDPKAPQMGDTQPPGMKDKTEPEAGSTTTETAKSEPERVPTTQPPIITPTTSQSATTQPPIITPTTQPPIITPTTPQSGTSQSTTNQPSITPQPPAITQPGTTQPAMTQPVTTQPRQPVTISPTAPISLQPIPSSTTQTGSTPVIPSITPGPSTGPLPPVTPPSPPMEDMVILPTGERMPKSVIVGYEQVCNDKRMNATEYLSRNSSALGLPSSQIMLEPGIAFDPIRKDCVYPIQAYNSTSRQWSPKNMRIPVGIIQNFK